MSNARKSRSYPDQDLANDLILWVNETKDKEGSERVLELVRCFEQLLSMQASSRDPEVTTRWPANSSEFEQVISRLNGLLSHYTVMPYIFSLGDEFGPGWIPIKGGALYRSHKAHLARSSSLSSREMREFDGVHTRGEISAVESLFAIVRMKKFYVIGICWCSRLFFRERKDKRTCSILHRLEADKPERAEKARVAYAKEKRKDKNAQTRRKAPW